MMFLACRLRSQKKFRFGKPSGRCSLHCSSAAHLIHILLNCKCTFGRGGVNEEWATVPAVRFFLRGNAVCHIMKEQFFPAQKRLFLIFLFWSVCLNRLVNMSINTRATLLQVERSWSSEIAASFADCRKRVSAILRFWSSLRDIVFDGRVNYAKNRNQNKQRVDDVTPCRILKVLDFRLEQVKYTMSSYHDLI